MTPSQVIDFIREIVGDSSLNLEDNSSLVGTSSDIDSMTLVQLCLKLEETAIELGFSFDWTSEKAMSSMNSTFRSPKSISEEFNTQLTDSKQVS